MSSGSDCRITVRIKVLLNADKKMPGVEGDEMSVMMAHSTGLSAADGIRLKTQAGMRV